MQIWIISNLRFIKAFLPLNTLKVISNTLGIIFFTYYWIIKINNTSDFTSAPGVYNISILLLIVVITCLCYGVIQRQAISLRMKEIFVWKWFGIKRRKLFWLFLTEHLLILACSTVISIALFDGFLNLFTTAGNAIKYHSLQIFTPISIIVFMLSVSTLSQIFILLRMNKQEVFNKLSA